MKIYFACSIRGGRDDAAFYADLVAYLKNHCTVLTEIFADGKLTAEGSSETNDFIWKRDIQWIKEADALIAEVTNPSLGVGYEIAKAEEWNKPVLVLFRDTGERRLSAMIEGSPRTKTAYYTNTNEAQQVLSSFIRSLEHNTSFRASV